MAEYEMAILFVEEFIIEGRRLYTRTGCMCFMYIIYFQTRDFSMAQEMSSLAMNMWHKSSRT